MSKVFGFLLRAVGYYAKFWAAAFTVSRIWEKAKIQAEKMDLKMFSDNLGKSAIRVLNLGEALLKIMAPFKWFTDKIASLIAPLLSFSFWLDKIGRAIGRLSGQDIKDFQGAVDAVKKALSGLGDFMIKLAAGMSAIAIKAAPSAGAIGGAALGAKLGPLGAMGGGVLGMMLGRKAQGAYEGMRLFEIWEKIQKEMETKAEVGDKNFVQNNLTNIAKVEIRNQFSENFDADRVAVTLVEQLEQAAQNPLGSIRNNPVKTIGLQTASN